MELTDFITILESINLTEEKIKPLQNRLNEERKLLNDLNEKLKYSSPLKIFLCEKILETYSEEELKQVDEYREYLNRLNSTITAASYCNSKIFDPYFDDWYIFDYEVDSNTEKIRFKISCKKNEGSISGLMTFLDTHYTNWFEISEFKDV